MFSVRIVDADFYVTKPVSGLDVLYSVFRESEVKRVPVIRIFGATPSGQKTCLHVHQVFPYIFVPYDGTQPTNKYLKQFSTSVDFAIQVALGKATSTTQHVYDASIVKRIPFYGYHEQEQDFIKIQFYNPKILTRAIDLLQNGAILNKVFQPHESHIPYILQFLIDFNLYGMNLLHAKTAKFRGWPRSEIEHTKSQPSPCQESCSPFGSNISGSFRITASACQHWDENTISNDLRLDSDVPKISRCELELDVISTDILNQLEIGTSVGTNPGIVAMWEDEKQRRRDHEQPSQIPMPVSQDRGDLPMVESEKDFKMRIREIISDRNKLVQSEIEKMEKSQVDSLSPEDFHQLSQSILLEANDPGSPVVLSNEVDENTPVVDESVIEDVLQASQSQSQRVSARSDRDLIDILVSLANDPNEEPPQECSPISRHTPITVEEDRDVEDESDNDDEVSMLMSQPVWNDDDDDGNMSESSDRSSQRDLEDLEELSDVQHIPQLDGVADIESDTASLVRTRNDTKGFPVDVQSNSHCASAISNCMIYEDCFGRIPQLDGCHDDEHGSQYKQEKSRRTGKITKIRKKTNDDDFRTESETSRNKKGDLKPKLKLTTRQRKHVVGSLAVTGGKTRERNTKKREHCPSLGEAITTVGEVKPNFSETITKVSETRTRVSESPMKTGEDRDSVNEVTTNTEGEAVVSRKGRTKIDEMSTSIDRQDKPEPKAGYGKYKNINNSTREFKSKTLTKKRTSNSKNKTISIATKQYSFLEELSFEAKVNAEVSSESQTSDFELRLSEGSSDDDFKSPKKCSKTLNIRQGDHIKNRTLPRVVQVNSKQNNEYESSTDEKWRDVIEEHLKTGISKAKQGNDGERKTLKSKRTINSQKTEKEKSRMKQAVPLEFTPQSISSTTQESFSQNQNDTQMTSQSSGVRRKRNKRVNNESFVKIKRRKTNDCKTANELNSSTTEADTKKPRNFALSKRTLLDACVKLERLPIQKEAIKTVQKDTKPSDSQAEFMLQSSFLGTEKNEEEFEVDFSKNSLFQMGMWSPKSNQSEVNSPPIPSSPSLDASFSDGLVTDLSPVKCYDQDGVVGGMVSTHIKDSFGSGRLEVIEVTKRICTKDSFSLLRMEDSDCLEFEERGEVAELDEWEGKDNEIWATEPTCIKDSFESINENENGDFRRQKYDKEENLGNCDDLDVDLVGVEFKYIEGNFVSGEEEESGDSGDHLYGEKDGSGSGKDLGVDVSGTKFKGIEDSSALVDSSPFERQDNLSATSQGARASSQASQPPYTTSVLEGKVSQPPYTTSVLEGEVSQPPYKTSVLEGEVSQPPYTTVLEGEVSQPPYTTSVLEGEVSQPPYTTSVLEGEASQPPYTTSVLWRPVNPSPSPSFVSKTRSLYGLPHERHQKAFCSDPKDLPRIPRIVGGRCLQISSKSLEELQEFDSGGNFQTLSEIRSLMGDNIDSSFVRGCLRTLATQGRDMENDGYTGNPVEIKLALMGEHDVVITPAKSPPTQGEVKKWVREKKMETVRSETVKCVAQPLKKSDGEVPGTNADFFVETEIIPKTPNQCNSLKDFSKKENIDNSPKARSSFQTPLLGDRSARLLELGCGGSKNTPGDVSHGPQHSTPLGSGQKSRGLLHCTPIEQRGLSQNSGKEQEVEVTFVGDEQCTRIKNLRRNILTNQVKENVVKKHSQVSVDASFIEGPTPNNSCGFKISQPNIQEAKSLHEVQFLTLLSVELHIRTRKKLRPDPEYDPICAIFYTLENERKENKQNITGVIIAKNESIKLSNTTDPSTSTSGGSEDQTGIHQDTSVSKGISKDNFLRNTGFADDIEVITVDEESDAIARFVELVHHWDPDILIGFEVQMLSWGYMLQRCITLGIDLASQLSRLQDSSGTTRFDAEKDKWGASHTSEITIAGRIVLNVWRLMRHEVALNIYSFENIAYHVLHERIPLYTFQQLSRWWDQKLPHNRWRIAEHYIRRCQGNIRILNYSDFVNRTSEFARLFGILFYGVISRGSQFRVESMMLRLVKPMNYVAVSPSIQQRVRQCAPECIPLVMEPESRFYSDPVVVLDFQSLYPSMIIAYNYCYSTCLGKVSRLDELGHFDFGCTSLNIPPSLLEKIEEDIHVSANGAAFVKSNIRKGVLPRMLEEILDTRVMVKKAMKQYKDDKILGRLLDARQLGLKLIANVTYGYTSANFSGRMPCVEIADAIVRKARETLERAIHLVNSREEWGARVVYGDTDSLFVLLKGATKDDAFKIGMEMVDAVTATNPKPVKLKFEKVYLPCVLQTKKRYVGYMYETLDQKEPVFDAKGVETVRRDTCPAVAKILEKSLRILFEVKDVSLVKKFVQRQFRKLMEDRVSLQDFIFAKEYRGMRNYKPKACVPALELTRRRLSRDRRAEPRVGERVPYVVVCGSPGLPLIQLVRSPEEVLEDASLRLNTSYYITKQIVPPLNRAFSLIGIDVLFWYTELPRFAPTKQQIPSGKQKCSISRYFTTLHCPVCEELTNQGLCYGCQKNRQKAIVTLANRIRNWERKNDHLTQVCFQCCGTNDPDLLCVSLDCPVLFKLTKNQRNLSYADTLREIQRKIEIYSM